MLRQMAIARWDAPTPFSRQIQNEMIMILLTLQSQSVQQMAVFFCWQSQYLFEGSIINQLCFIRDEYLSFLLALMIFKGLRLLAPRFSTSYSQAMYQAFKANPNDVHEDWHAVFNNQEKASSTQVGNPDHIQRQKSLALSAYMLIRYYKIRGHEDATLDPLRLVNFKEFGKVYIKNKLDHDLFNNKILHDKRLDQPFTFPVNQTFQDKIASFIGEKQEWTLREILHRLQFIYSDKTGIQFMHLSNAQERAWLMREFQKISGEETAKAEKMQILEELTKAETFNSFLSDKLKTSKRFGVEGLDSMISGLNKLVRQAVKTGVEYIGLGMAHRGRLNALANVFNKPMQKIFAEFQENVDKEVSWGNSGDVKYHLGVTTERNVDGKNVRLTILPNPSHLETVNPVVMGHVKAVKDALNNDEKSLAVLIHGDAAVAGQGVVYECLQMAYLDHYNINGVIHIVANNQIGFTTTPAEARTGLYCTNVAKSIQAPIIHVNADDPELVNKVIKMAVAYRQKFKKDIFVDIIGYRRYGHNEQDQPAFTQPMMYQTIGKRPTLYHIYAEKLVKEGVATEEEVKAIWTRQLSKISEAYAQSLKSTFDIKMWRSPTYHSVVDFTKLGQIKRTGISEEVLREIGTKISTVPESFNINPTIKKIYEQRRKSIETGENIDFGTAETLAYGSLLKEGFNVRFSGQDVERGTFSHRHAVLTDQKTQEKYIPVHSLLAPEEKGRFQIENSLLSEYAAMGFEYGYALTNPNTLTIWQAQFGDFANGAQIIVDNYLTSGQSKWAVQNGLVLNLPHGMDGQGPEHSSARMERYLQMMNDSWTELIVNNEPKFDPSALRHTNMSVICCSTGSNIFHGLRRQMRRDYRKPLIHFVNKKLLKLREAGTSFADLNRNHFDTIIDDASVDPNAVKKVVLLYGQAYYSALEKRTSLDRKDVALVRIEQLAPLHYSALVTVLRRYPNATQFVWFQEEHRNSGAWTYVQPRISVVLQWLHKNQKVRSSLLQCVSRKTSASTAVGKKKKHDEEQVQILNKLFEK